MTSSRPHWPSSAVSTSSSTPQERLRTPPDRGCDRGAWDEALDVTAKGTFFLAQAAAPALREAHGVLVIVEDVASFQPWTSFRPTPPRRRRRRCSPGCSPAPSRRRCGSAASRPARSPSRRARRKRPGSRDPARTGRFARRCRRRGRLPGRGRIRHRQHRGRRRRPPPQIQQPTHPVVIGCDRCDSAPYDAARDLGRRVDPARGGRRPVGVRGSLPRYARPCSAWPYGGSAIAAAPRTRSGDIRVHLARRGLVQAGARPGRAVAATRLRGTRSSIARGLEPIVPADIPDEATAEAEPAGPRGAELGRVARAPALEELPEREREVISLAYWSGLSRVRGGGVPRHPARYREDTYARRARATRRHPGRRTR